MPTFRRVAARRPARAATALVTACALALGAGAAQAQLAFTEVAPWSSGNSAVAADWFEITNFGTETVSLVGLRVDDSSNSFAASVALNGVLSLAPGQSAVFIEGSTANANFLSTWFGANAPAGLLVGSYSGSGIGLGTGGDALNLFSASGTLLTRVDFGASPSNAPFATFDNAAGSSGITLATLSVVGVNGAFLAAAGGEIGSPGTVGVVPEPGTWALMLAGLAAVAGIARRRVA